MDIGQERTGTSTVVLTLNGRLDTVNAPLLESKIKEQENITELTLDFKEVTYISSMGLRVLLQAKKATKANGAKLSIINLRDSVREIFEMTGFMDLMMKEEKA